MHEGSPGEIKKEGRIHYHFDNQQALKELVEAFHTMEHIRELHLYHEDIKKLGNAFRNCFHCLYAGGGVVSNKEGKFLVIERNGVWDLPKGKLEEGEDFLSAALREVEEETGLVDLQHEGFLMITYHTYMLSNQLVLKETRWFEMHYPGDAPPLLQEKEGITNYRWVSRGEGKFIVDNSYGTILEVLKRAGLL